MVKEKKAKAGKKAKDCKAELTQAKRHRKRRYESHESTKSERVPASSVSKRAYVRVRLVVLFIVWEGKNHGLVIIIIAWWIMPMGYSPMETTSGSIAENKQLMGLIEQHTANTGTPVSTVVADSKYGTVENFVKCQQQGIKTHLGDVLAKQTNNPRRKGIFPDTAFSYGGSPCVIGVDRR